MQFIISAGIQKQKKTKKEIVIWNGDKFPDYSLQLSSVSATLTAT